LSEHREVAAAKQFFTQAITQHGPPEKITADGSPVTHTVISELKAKNVLPPEHEGENEQVLEQPR
jgi:transposase-like protein